MIGVLLGGGGVVVLLLLFGVGVGLFYLISSSIMNCFALLRLK